MTQKALSGKEAPPEKTGATPPRPSAIKPIPDDALIIIPMRNTVLFPGVVIPLSIGRSQSVAAAQEAARSEARLGIILQRDPEVDVPGPDDLHAVGTVAEVLRYVTAPDGSPVGAVPVPTT